MPGRSVGVGSSWRVHVGMCFAGLGGAVPGWAGYDPDGWPRFLDAHGDHPPYSRLRIVVAPGRTDVLYGGEVEVRAMTSGRPVDKLWLVTRTGTQETRAMMFIAPDKSFFQSLANLREPTEYYVTDGTARSLRFPIGIRYTPQITMVEVGIAFPEYTGLPSRAEN